MPGISRILSSKEGGPLAFVQAWVENKCHMSAKAFVPVDTMIRTGYSAEIWIEKIKFIYRAVRFCRILIHAQKFTIVVMTQLTGNLRIRYLFL